MWVVSEASLGFIVSFLRSPWRPQTAEDLAVLTDLGPVGVLHMWVKGALVVETALAFIFSQTIGTFCIRLLGLEERLGHWRVAVLRVMGEIKQSFRETHWTLQSLPLDDIEQLLVWPLFQHLVLYGGLPVALLSLVLGADRTLLSALGHIPQFRPEGGRWAPIAETL